MLAILLSYTIAIYCVINMKAAVVASNVNMFWPEKFDASLVVESVLLADLAIGGGPVGVERVTVKRTIIVNV
jgi:hypothetical protein